MNPAWRGFFGSSPMCGKDGRDGELKCVKCDACGAGRFAVGEAWGGALALEDRASRGGWGVLFRSRVRGRLRPAAFARLRCGARRPGLRRKVVGVAGLGWRWRSRRRLVLPGLAALGNPGRLRASPLPSSRNRTAHPPRSTASSLGLGQDRRVRSQRRARTSFAACQQGRPARRIGKPELPREQAQWQANVFPQAGAMRGQGLSREQVQWQVKVIPQAGTVAPCA